MRHGDKTDAAHLVLRFLAPTHPDRGTGGIARVLGRVVPMDFDIEPGSARQYHELPEEISVLPGEIPIVDQQQSFYITPGQSRRHFQLFSDVVRVRADAHRV